MRQTSVRLVYWLTVQRRYGSLLLLTLLILGLVATFHRAPSTVFYRNTISVPDCTGCSAWDASRSVDSLFGQQVFKQLSAEFSEESISTRCRRMAFPGGKCYCKGKGKAVNGTCSQRAKMDGKKPVCLDGDLLPETADCLVYSFGVRNDPSFESEMARLGCEVHAFDPTIAQLTPPQLPPNVSHHLIGIDGRTWTHRADDGSEIALMSLDDLTLALGHQGRRIHYLKLDVEGSEWDMLQQQLTSRGTALHHVSQLHVEFHLPLPRGRLSANPKWQYQLVEEDARRYLKTLRALQAAGFRLAHIRSMWAFPGIDVKQLYETLWIQEGQV